MFDVKMGRYDRAEGCELVGNFLLYAFSLKDNKTDIGLYKDDGLTVAYRLAFWENQRGTSKAFLAVLLKIVH